MVFAIPHCLVWYLDYEICHSLTLAPIVTCYGGRELSNTSVPPIHPTSKPDPL